MAAVEPLPEILQWNLFERAKFLNVRSLGAALCCLEFFLSASEKVQRFLRHAVSVFFCRKNGELSLRGWVDTPCCAV